MIPTDKVLAALGSDVVLALSDDDRNGTRDPLLLENLFSSAEEQVRDALAVGGYTNVTVLTPLLEDLAVTLAIESLFLRRREMIPGPWADRANRARTILGEIAARRRAVPDLGSPSPQVSSPDADEPPLHRRRTLRHL